MTTKKSGKKNKSVSTTKVKNKHSKRTRQAKNADKGRIARKTFKLSNPEGRSLWYSDPGKFDIWGIDAFKKKGGIGSFGTAKTKTTSQSFNVPDKLGKLQKRRSTVKGWADKRFENYKQWERTYGSSQGTGRLIGRKVAIEDYEKYKKHTQTLSDIDKQIKQMNKSQKQPTPPKKKQSTKKKTPSANQKANIKTYSSNSDLNKQIKDYLKIRFPDTFFSIRQRQSGGKRTLNVTWYQKPSKAAVKAVVEQFRGYDLKKEGSGYRYVKRSNPYPFHDFFYDFRNYDRKEQMRETKKLRQKGEI